MRVFYIFKIKKPYVILTKNNPYHLYKTIEHIYYLKPNELKLGTNVFDNLSGTFNKDNLNDNLYSYYKSKESYTKFKNTHTIIDYFTKEKSRLIINKSYLLIQSTEEVPSFLKILSKNKGDIFVCDFQNKDYFWLDKIA